ncbi:MAG: hypothetical protein AB8B86_01295 [Pseudomonadales bacterium]
MSFLNGKRPISLKLKQKQRLRYRRPVSLLVLLSFFLQVLIPVGYMPAAVASGQFFQLCPSGLSPELMQLLHPQHKIASSNDLESSKHHHGTHTEALDDAPAEMGHGSEHSAWSNDCPYGASVSNDFLTLNALTPEKNPQRFQARISARSIDAAVLVLPSSNRPRAPPFFALS